MGRVTIVPQDPVVRTRGWSSSASTSSAGLAMDAPRQASSGHSGTAMALAPLAHVLWTRVMHHDPLDPTWPDRDRFVLSCGHASILQYALLHLTGYDLTLDDLRQFRQWGAGRRATPSSATPPGIEVTTGPLGQGFANAVGMALAERVVRARFGAEVCDHRIFVLRRATAASWRASPTRRPRWPGTSAWAALLAVYDDNHITIDGPTELAYNDDAGEAVRGLRLGGAAPGRGRQRRRRPGGGGERGARVPGRRSGRPAQSARAAQPHRLALARS